MNMNSSGQFYDVFLLLKGIAVDFQPLSDPVSTTTGNKPYVNYVSWRDPRPMMSRLLMYLKKIPFTTTGLDLRIICPRSIMIYWILIRDNGNIHNVVSNRHNQTLRLSQTVPDDFYKYLRIWKL